MSTKTTIKRVALVAVSVMGLGLLPMSAGNAAAGVAVSTSLPTKGADSNVLIGAEATSVVGATIGSALLAADDQVYTGTTITLSVPAFSVAGATANVVAAVNSTSGAVTGDAADAVVAGAINFGTVAITPDVAGTYKITVKTTNGATASTTVYAADMFASTADGVSAGDQSDLSVNGVAGVANFVTIRAYQDLAAGRDRLITVDGGTMTTNSAGTLATDGKSLALPKAGGGAKVNQTFRVPTPTAGTITVKMFSESAQAGIFSTTAIGTVTITVNSSASNGTVSVADSEANMNVTGVTNGYLSTDELTAYAPRTAGAKAATIVVELAPAAGAALSSLTSTTVTITGPGSIGIDTDQNGTENGSTGRSLTSTTGDDAEFDVIVRGDGTSGVATVKVVTGGFSATFTVNFFGSVASYKLTQKNGVISVGVTDAQVATVQALDASGIEVPNAVIYVTSSSSSVATLSGASVTTGADGAAADLGATGVSAGTATVTFANATSAPTVTATWALKIVKAGISSVALSFDKETYNPGEKATITVTAKNADGELVGDNTYANMFSSAGITSSAALQGYTATGSVATTSGVKTYTVYMPLTSGPVSISATLSTDVAAAIQLTSVTASTKVGATAAEAAAEAASDAAAEAIDAANAATDAANLAAEAADAATVAAEEARDAADAATAAVEELATQVATLMAALKAQITTLANTVAKIAKKVKA
jgi:hypothetical protein